MSGNISNLDFFFFGNLSECKELMSTFGGEVTSTKLSMQTNTRIHYLTVC